MTDDLELIGQSNATVLDLLDRLLNTGVVLAGDLSINVADIELVYLRLQVMLTSTETARQAGWLRDTPALENAAHG